MPHAGRDRRVQPPLFVPGGFGTEPKTGAARGLAKLSTKEQGYESKESPAETQTSKPLQSDRGPLVSWRFAAAWIATPATNASVTSFLLPLV
jgi:hypothetical protein